MTALEVVEFGFVQQLGKTCHLYLKKKQKGIIVALPIS